MNIDYIIEQLIQNKKLKLYEIKKKLLSIF